MTVEKNVPAVEEKAQEVDRIRDIIFGSQMRTYDSNFQMIQRDLERLQQGIDHLKEALAEQEKAYSQKLQLLERELRKADDGLRDELREPTRRLSDEKADRQMLGDLFIELGSQLKSTRTLSGAIEDMLKPKKD